MKSRSTTLLVILLLNLSLVCTNTLFAGSRSFTNTPFHPVLTTNVVSNEITVTWEMINKDRLEYYVLQRSNDGVVFENLTSFAEETEENGKYKFMFVDSKPLNKKNYYRVKLVDVDGKSTYTDISYAGNIDLVFKFELYPNPSKEAEVRVKVEGVDGKAPLKVDIFELSGRCIKSYTFENYSSFESYVALNELDQLRAGIYVVIGTAGFDSFRTTLVRE